MFLQKRKTGTLIVSGLAALLLAFVFTACEYPVSVNGPGASDTAAAETPSAQEVPLSLPDGYGADGLRTGAVKSGCDYDRLYEPPPAGSVVTPARGRFDLFYGAAPDNKKVALTLNDGTVFNFKCKRYKTGDKNREKKYGKKEAGKWTQITGTWADTQRIWNEWLHYKSLNELNFYPVAGIVLSLEFDRGGIFNDYTWEIRNDSFKSIEYGWK